MGTYDTIGGTPRHDPAFDQGDDPHPLADEVLEILENAAVPTPVNDQVAAAIENYMAEAMELPSVSQMLKATEAPDLRAALQELWTEVGKTGWHNAAPTFGERKKRADILNRSRAALGNPRT